MINPQNLKIVEEGIILSNLAYLYPDQIEKELISYGYTDFIWIENKKSDTQVFSCMKNGHLKFAFRGTEFTNLEDWFTNLDCRFEEISPAYSVHKGFYEDCKSVHDDIIDIIKLQAEPEKISIMGHSQGAGDATIEAIMLLNHYPLYAVVPVASPRCLSKQSALDVGLAYGNLFHRVVNNNDIVTRIPTRAMGYAHIIENINFYYFKETGELVDYISEWDLFKDRIHGIIDDFFKLGADGFKDHFGSYYANLIANAINTRGLNV